MEVTVPDLGDFSDVEVIEVLVKPGDLVGVEDSLITLETDKATMDVPSPAAGRVSEVRVAPGSKVSAGDLIVVLDSAGADQESAQDSVPAEVAPVEEPAAESGSSESPAEAEPSAPEIVSVPELGDFNDVAVIELLVAVGDEVDAEQGLITLETDKATMDVPSPIAGTVLELKVDAGGTVNPGDAVAVIQPVPSGAAPAPTSAERPRAGTASAAGHPPPSTQSPARVPADDPMASTVTALPAVGIIDEDGFSRAHASPSVRKLARELGVDLGRVEGKGLKGRVTADDVKVFVKRILTDGVPGGATLPEVPRVDFAKFGPVEQIALTRIQKISGPRLHASWVNLPHVTQHDDADITELEERRRALKQQALGQDIRLTPLAFIMRAVVLTLADFPQFRSSLTPDGKGLVVKNYYHLGFAADTPDGLVVPVIRDADRMDLFELAAALGDLSARAREGKLGAGDVQGGVFTVSSLGGIGGSYFTPIINAPEVAILGVSRSRMQPVYDAGTFTPRLLLPLSLSYDHRVIDGAQAARFITQLAATLGQVDRLVAAIP